MAEEKIFSVDFAKENPYANILPRSPVISSYKSKWNGIRLDFHRQPGYETPEHSPNQHTLSISLVNRPIKAERLLDGRIQTEIIKYGDIVVVPANINHKLCWESEAEFLVISLDSELFDRVSYDTIDLQRCEIIPHFTFTDPLIQHIGLALKSELESTSMSSILYIDSLAATLCLHLLKKYSKFLEIIPTYSEGLSQMRLRKAIEYIDENLDQDLSLMEIAGIVQMSMYHFSRLFKQSTGLSPHQYVTNCRIEKAKRLLARTEEAINQIGQQVGFPNQSHFTSVFRKYIGITPKAYREQVKV
ncbi:helix-turn-helix domain-containing protein [Chlorogloeopsis fritschii PCC 9212]|uniref:AraC family transcriptional regulator n=1 Tax=Chlorogloeopsis fritschii PCC 6912 TaxID=211165 RepID=A0A3S1A0P4_CHLFR|nr:AraC family transcriptional regulator [Chlorogloeopsis fritschii]RUR76785.1 AraC family transcriptional regulator [Chlorogloeopsis fritschii PCC 6912]